MKGSTFLAENDMTCPYCEQGLSPERASKLRELDSVAIKDIKPLFNSTNVLAELDISRPDLTKKKNVGKFEEDLLEVKKTKDEINKVLAFGSMSRHVSAIDKVPDKIVVEDVVYKRSPELRPLIESINEKADSLKSLVGGMKRAFNSLVRSNTRELNDELKSLEMPYEFALDSVAKAISGQLTSSFTSMLLTKILT